MKIESLRKYHLSNDYAYFGILIAYIYNTFEPLNIEFPNYRNWFFNKQLAEISVGKREILFVRNSRDKSDIIAVACLKKDDEEKKICGIYVKERYRNLGYGTKLFEKSFNWLKTNKPSISIPENKLYLFNSFIDKYNWNLTGIRDSYYCDHKEYCYNKEKVKIIKK